MREILFRGKCGYNNEWVEGFYYQAKLNRSDKELCHYITTPHPECDGKPSDHIMVHPATVGQFTGLTDKNGKKIFEGDVIKQIYSLNGLEREIISVIEYGISYAYSNCCGVCQRFRDGSGVSLLSVNGEDGVVYCDVIGNIHDNPELL